MLKEVGGVAVQPRRRATCHCGTVELEFDLPAGIVNPRRCDCSICRRKSAVVASVPLAGLHVVKGSEHLRLYEFNTRTAKHYFCGNCGIYTHHQRRSNPEQYGFNVGCLEGINPFDIADVPVEDGVHHPADRVEGNPADVANATLRHHMEVQAEEAGRIRHRNALQARILLVLATALFSAFAALVVFRYVWLDKFDAISVLVLVALAAGWRIRWRAV